jgi:DNA-binding MarR family transcriptional regulator
VKHAVSPKRPVALANHELHEHRILDHLESGDRVTQRALSRELGIALGLTNLLIRRLVNKGWVRMSRVSRSRILYLITPVGIAEKTRLSRAYFASSLKFYREARDRIRERFTTLSNEWPAQAEPGSKRIVFYGANEVAEIGYICLAETDLQLVGVVDAARTQPFFGVEVRAPHHLMGVTLDGAPFDRVVVMSLGSTEELRAELIDLGVPLDRVFWL